VADWPAIAGLGVDIAGAVLLARGLALEAPYDYVRTHPRRQHPGTVDAGADLQRAKDQAEARLGAFLLILGFAGQLVGSFRADWPPLVDTLAVTLAVAIVVGVIAVRPTYVRCWEAKFFTTRAWAERMDVALRRADDPEGDQGIVRVVIDYWQELERVNRVRVPETGTSNLVAKTQAIEGELRVDPYHRDWIGAAMERLRDAGQVD
jgi:hypothetical protein